MGILDKVMAMVEEVETPTPQPADNRPRVRVTWGADGVIRWPEPAAVEEDQLPQVSVDLSKLRAGDTCPRCHGTGWHQWHLDADRKETCYWCKTPGLGSVGGPGKGVLSSRDLLYIRKRAGNGTLSLTASA